MPEYPVEKAGLEGTGLTEAVCPKHKGKVRVVSADALLAKGAPALTFALKCLEPLTKAAKDAENLGQTGSPIRTGEVSANGTVHATGAPHNAELCQEFLVPVDAFDEAGRQVRKDGKLLDRPIPPKAAKRGEDQGPKAFEPSEPVATGGEKVAAASGTTTKKATKKSARKSTRKKAA